MKIRTISGAVFVAILVGAFLLRQFVSPIIFQALTAFFLIMGTFEISRALKDYAFKGFRVLALIYSIIFVAVYCVLFYLLHFYQAFIVCLLLILVFAIITLFFGVFSDADITKTLINVIPFVYPALFMLALFMINDFGVDSGFFLLLLTFIIATFSDTFAYLVGMTYSKIRKGNVKKLCPKLSPNKTVAGAIGGTIGGAVGTLALYLIIKPQFNLNNPILFFIILGAVASVVNIFGDLFESLIKRKVGIKDMGKIMPGHGGVMDRIDGLSFVALLISVVFVVVFSL